jgi:glutathione reductase (NADPH)
VKNHFNILVIGSGVAGSTIAMKCASAGLNTAIVDCRPYGGTCAIRGCDSKKILVDASEYLDVKNRIPALIAKNPVINWDDLMKFKKSFTDPVPLKREKSYANAKIAMLKGKATFDSGNSVIINNEKYSADKIVIATGAKPGKLNIKGEENLINSDAFLELEKLPGEIIFVGGGFISFEFAHVAARFGTKVKIIHNDNYPIDMFDNDMAAMLIDYSRNIGIDIILSSPVNAIEKKNGKFIVSADDTEFTTDLVVHGAGRVADIDDLNLEAASIEHGNGIFVNEYMQSVSNEHVYAAGDAAAGSPPLTPVGAAEAKIVSENIIKGNKIKRIFKIVPFTLFTIPPLASVGLSEENAVKKGLDFRKNISDTSNWYHSKKTGFRGTGFKVLIDNSTDLIIGAYILSPNAEDIINLITMAMHASLTVSELKDMIFTYPSISSDIKYMI